MAQFIRDVLTGGINSIQKHNGIVVGFAGDQFISFIENVEDVFMALVGIAKDLDRMCEYLYRNNDVFRDPINTIKIKIGVEYGLFDVSDMESTFLGKQKIFVSSAINYASRTMNAGFGNRCNIGPCAFEKGLNQFIDSEKIETEGKKGESLYSYYNLDLNDVWRNDDLETFWG